MANMTRIHNHTRTKTNKHCCSNVVSPYGEISSIVIFNLKYKIKFNATLSVSAHEAHLSN